MTRVLIVDDNAENLYLLRAMLQGHGYVVDEARHGVEALAKARQNAPDLAVSDLLMPVMDGYMLLRQWRADERLGSIPFVVYTATYTEPRDERLAMALGADAFVIKPAEPEPLMVIVEDVLARRDRGELHSASGRPFEDVVLLNDYNEVLVHKLEKKATELEETNRELIEEIAERKRTEAALRESEERYRTLFESIADPLFVYDRETLAYLAVNDAAVADYGYSRDELLSMTIKDIRPAEDVPALLDTIAQSGTGLEARGTWRHVKKDGSVIEVEISTHDLDFAGRPACVVQARDVTEVRRNEAKVAHTSRLLRSVVEGTSDAVFVKDRDGKYLLFNEAAARYVGKSVEEVLGKDDTELLGAEGARAVMASDRQVMETNESHTSEEPLSAAGAFRIFHAFRAPYRDERGNVVGVLGISRDITDRKRLEDELRQSQKMEAVGRLAGGVAHDFNNLLTVISGYSELMLARPDVSDQMRESIKAIGEAGKRATALTRQLLGFSRRTMLQPRVLDLNAVVVETGEMLRRLIGEDILFTTVPAPDLSRVKVDPGQLDQVLMNLAVNARDAMPNGGKLTIETANVLLSDDDAAFHFDCTSGPHVMLAMSDTGCGMAPDVMARIFEPYFTTKEVGKGTGLGLAVVFGIVRQSDGCIHVYSEPGQGTTFKIYFPAVSERASGSSGSEPAIALGGAETILLVEDDAAVRKLALMSLEMHGYEVLSATDGEDALRIAKAHRGPIDLILTDVVMPNVGGRELARHLQLLFPGVKVLFMSGYADDAVVRHGLLEADISFIQKPYTPLGLAEKVRQVLDEDTTAGP
jgi:two-component system, cell cycle sensor histidine kinase and response regulator CckA